MRLIDANAIKLEKGFFEKIDNVPKFFEWLGNQPTVNPVKWIPVSERLPDISGSYLATVYSGKHSPFVNVDYFFKSTGEWDYYRVDVIAWAEMPEPWRGEEG